ncbi:MAG TPA: hypothetical protein VF337_09885 [Candidatus Limnocylindrales bacterium]
MERILGAIAIFAGWLAVPAGAITGLFASEFLGLAHKEGSPPPLAVYGMSAGVVLWVFVFAAFLTGFPLAYAMFAEDPRWRLRVIAVAMTMCGLGLLLDPLGRAFGLPLFVGAACLWAGGELIHKEALAIRSVAAPEATDAAFVESQAPVDDLSSPEPIAAETRTRAQGKRSRRDTSKTVCPWCSAEVPAQAQTCPECQASLGESDVVGLGIPGLTEVQPSLRKYLEESRAGKKRGGILRTVFSGSDSGAPVSTIPPSDAAAILPPSARIKAEMARLDAEIASGREWQQEPSEPPEPTPPESPAS